MKGIEKIPSPVYAILASLLLLLCFTACSPNTVPIQKDISNAELVITNAQSATATQHAPLELRLAKEKLDQARTALNEENYRSAQFLAQEALVTANLAQEKTRTQKTMEIVRELRESIDTLNKEILEMQKTSQGRN